METDAQVKPLLRGVSHQIAFYLALGAGVVLVAMAHSVPAMVAATVYSLSLAAMFGISALYHRPTWRPPSRRWLRRLDHAAIFLFIAGTYTPICLLVLEGVVGTIMLWSIWIAAALGMFKALFWAHAPKIVTALVYIAVGWLAVPTIPQLIVKIGLWAFILILAGGLIYTAGAIIYAIRRPNPAPAVFGYHEIFHALVIAASICHFVVVAYITRLA